VGEDLDRAVFEVGRRPVHSVPSPTKRAQAGEGTHQGHRIMRGASPPRHCISRFQTANATLPAEARARAPRIAFPIPARRGAERRDGAGCLRGTPGVLRHAEALARRLASPCDRGRAPLGALPWRFMMAPVRASGFGISSEARAASSSRPGFDCPAGGSRASRDCGYEPPLSRGQAAAAERHSPLRHGPSPETPAMSGDDSRILS
jgi:hypothetical protein